MTSNAQNLFPASGFLYEDEEVPRIDITIDPMHLESILEPGNEESDYEYPATFTMIRGTEVKTEENIGFRLRGNTSRYSAKKSFKVSINSFTPGRTFQGVEKINLNGEHNDPSISRAKLSWELFRSAGVPASRANHIELYINEEYRGLYINVEHIDEEFVDLRFGNNDGNLYKCLYPADLTFLGNDPDLYKYTQENRRAYELKRNEELDDYSDLANLIDILNNTDPVNFQENLEPVFNVNTYLKNLVIEILTGHWDAYSFNKNNYYLYKNEANDKFEFIPYDTDNTFGIDWFNEDWANRDIYNWAHPHESRPLTEKILQNEVYRDRYSFYMKRFLNEYYNAEYLDPLITSIKERISPFIETDLYRTYDYEWNYDDFDKSFGTYSDAHVKHGIREFIDLRRESALQQLEEVNIAPVISNVYHNSPFIGENIIITALVEDESTPSGVTLWYSGGGAYSSSVMQKTGEETYRAIIPGLSWAGNLDYYIEASDENSQTTREPFSGSYSLKVTALSAPEYFSNTTEIDVYPNPFNSGFMISFAVDSQIIHYQLYDISGKRIIEGKSQESSVWIDSDKIDSAAGLYFLHIKIVDADGKIITREYRKMVFMK